MPINRRRALGLLTVVLGACSTGDGKDGISTGFTTGEPDTGTTGTSTGETGTDMDTDDYGTDGGGDGDYFDGERSAEDVDLDR